MNIHYPGFGSIVVDGKIYEHDIVIDSGVVRRRDKSPSKKIRGLSGHTPLSAAEDIPWSKPRLVIGSGYSGSLPVLPEVAERAQALGVDLVVLPTAEACRLLGTIEAADVNAILHVTC